ncbi:hypothetical protein B7C42_00119 [Nocardia cerradoensis]|uniref:Uncharacterized protein n=1 Tax=Nocardia cerradoensis TaxID=85688 RepID=A0A231HDV0_9NOCA|nr:hypothetical protein [Nocardia cerradoensis]OXR47002.1 hypothetical protein B7C42_00119 [Nocardia cerradoensis]
MPVVFSEVVEAVELVLGAAGRVVRSTMRLHSDDCTPQYVLRVSLCGVTEIEETISEMYARIIALLALKGGEHCHANPDHLPFIAGRIALTVEAALQASISSHAVWVDLCEKCEQPLEVVLDVRPASSESVSEFSGGLGGSGGWFGAGGGGGGVGLLNGGAGGEGADGALLIFQIAEDNSLLDIDAFVTTGSFLWTRRPDVDRIEVVAIGGGGGGASGGRLI